MERSLMKELEKWKDSPHRKPLLIRGARQVGKTWLMRELGARCFEKTIYINFDRDRRLHDVFLGDIEPHGLVAAIGAVSGETIAADDTLIIFDEIQEEPRALTALKYFCEDAPEYAVIAAGSLMGVALHAGTSFPVGKVNEKVLYPLNFLEFLSAVGDSGLRDIIESKDVTRITEVHGFLIDALRTYYFVGGMPEAVKTFAESGDYVAVRGIQEVLLDYYEQDFSKHAPTALVPRLHQVWHSIPAQLAKENRKYIFGQVTKGARAKDFELAIRWLSDCGLLHIVHRIKVPRLPIKAYEELNAFKLYMLDVGLLGAMGGLGSDTIVDKSRLFTEFKGAMTEQYVLQELIAGLGMHPGYYSAENSRGEVDFIAQGAGGVIPIEVKAEENLQAKSLKAFVEKYEIPKGVRISMSDYREQDWLVNLPLYAFMGFFYDMI